METKKVPASIRFMQFALLFSIGFMVYIGYLVFQPNPNVKTDLPLQLDKNAVKADEQLNIKTTYCSQDNIKQRVIVQLVKQGSNDSTYTLYTVDEINVKKGCHSDTMPVDTKRFNSFSLQDGEYKMRLRVITQLNPIKESTVLLDSEKFTYTK